MALKFRLDTLEGLDEALKPLYAKGDDGKYLLQTEDSPAFAGLKTELRAAQEALKAKDAADAKIKADAEKAKLEAQGDYEKLKANIEGEKAQLIKEKEEANAGLKSYLLKSELTAAIAKHKGNPLLEKLIADQFEAVISPDGAHKVLLKGDATKTADIYVESLKADANYGAFFEGSGASGGGASNPGRATVNAFEKMTKTELTKAANNPATAAAAAAFINKS